MVAADFFSLLQAVICAVSSKDSLLPAMAVELLATYSSLTSAIILAKNTMFFYSFLCRKVIIEGRFFHCLTCLISFLDNVTYHKHTGDDFL